MVQSQKINLSPFSFVGPNARHEPLPEAGATQERTLSAVGSMPLLGGEGGSLVVGYPHVFTEPLSIGSVQPPSHLLTSVPTSWEESIFHMLKRILTIAADSSADRTRINKL